MHKDIIIYNNTQSDSNKAICELLARYIQDNLPEAEIRFSTADRFGF